MLNLKKTLEKVIQNHDLVHLLRRTTQEKENVIRQYECDKFVFFDDNGPNMLERKELCVTSVQSIKLNI